MFANRYRTHTKSGETISTKQPTISRTHKSVTASERRLRSRNNDDDSHDNDTSSADEGPAPSSKQLPVKKRTSRRKSLKKRVDKTKQGISESENEYEPKSQIKQLRIQKPKESVADIVISSSDEPKQQEDKIEAKGQIDEEEHELEYNELELNQRLHLLSENVVEERHSAITESGFVTTTKRFSRSSSDEPVDDSGDESLNSMEGSAKRQREAEIEEQDYNDDQLFESDHFFEEKIYTVKRSKSTSVEEEQDPSAPASDTVTPPSDLQSFTQELQDYTSKDFTEEIVVAAANHILIDHHNSVISEMGPDQTEICTADQAIKETHSDVEEHVFTAYSDDDNNNNNRSNSDGEFEESSNDGLSLVNDIGLRSSMTLGVLLEDTSEVSENAGSLEKDGDEIQDNAVVSNHDLDDFKENNSIGDDKEKEGCPDTAITNVTSTTTSTTKTAGSSATMAGELFSDEYNEDSVTDDEPLLTTKEEEEEEYKVQIRALNENAAKALLEQITQNPYADYSALMSRYLSYARSLRMARVNTFDGDGDDDDVLDRQ